MSNAKASSTGTVIRLSIMMFLQFFIWGAWYVALWGFLDQNGMTAIGAGGSYDAAAYTVSPYRSHSSPTYLGTHR